ncbi:MAG: beta-mannosidase [Marmoricola sp.]|nr:beta-mannosidase [Marmoricola sp.]
MSDLLEGVRWDCAAEPSASGGEGQDTGDGEADRPPSGLAWVPAAVPGTTAGALLDAGDEDALLRDHDARTWWFRCRFPAPGGPTTDPHLLALHGLATLADVWLNGEHVLHSENMFLSHEVEVAELGADNELLIRFSPLRRHLEQMGRRRPRARWRTVRLQHQNLRWVRTTTLGRVSGRVATAAPVGPWRPVTLLPVPALRVERRTLRAVPLPDGSGEVVLEAVLREAGVASDRVVVEVLRDGAPVGTATAEVQEVDGARTVAVRVAVPAVDLWWPHTHGDQPLYDVRLTDEQGRTHPVGRVGFRTLEVDRRDGAFQLVVNGVPVFARGTSWMPPDADRLVVDPARERTNVELLRDAHHNVVRVPGNTVYPSPTFLDLLDELGLMLWQDAMFAFVDVPDDEELHASATRELRQAFGALQGRPCLAVVCGGADTEEQAEYQGLATSALGTTMSEQVLPALVEELLPGTAYLSATPGGSDLPTAVDQGVSHYFGVGPYLFPPQDARRAGVRFAAECLPFATPLTPLSPEARAHAERGLGTSPDPRAAVHRDHAQALWDVEDTRDHYTTTLFGVDVLRLRQQDPDLAEQLFATTCAVLHEQTLAEWRRPGSPCAGAITLYGHDLRLGPGLGLVDVLDRPKATWFAMRRTLAPVALLATDEGFSGLALHAVNDTAVPLEADLRLDLYAGGETLLETAVRPLVVPARGATTVSTATLLGGFRDLTWVHRFGEPAADVVVASLVGPGGDVLSTVVHLPAGPARLREDDVGLAGRLEPADDGWTCEVTTRRLAQRVHLDLPGWIPDDAWFDLPPGAVRRLRLRPETWPGAVGRPPAGRVVAVNSRRTALLHRTP